MRNRFRDVGVACVTAGLLAAGSMLVPRSAGQTSPPQGTAGEPRRTAGGKADFSGVWQANNTANWDLQTHGPRPMVAQPGVYKDVPVLAAPVLALGSMGWVPAGMGVVTGDGQIPYQPWAQKRRKENLEQWLDRDPELRCYMPGTPRGMYMPYPYRIVQSANKIMIVFEFAGAQRTIHLDSVDRYPGDAYMGHSVGHWEGDTLVVDVTRLTAQTWLDRSGNFHSDALHVVERFTPMGRDAMQYEATIEDAQVFTRPWTIRMPIYRRMEPDARLMEFRCQEMVEETFLGHLRKQPLVKRWDGQTMRIDVTRKIPPGNAAYERHVDGNPPSQ